MAKPFNSGDFNFNIKIDSPEVHGIDEIDEAVQNLIDHININESEGINNGRKNEQQSD